MATLKKHGFCALAIILCLVMINIGVAGCTINKTNLTAAPSVAPVEEQMSETRRDELTQQLLKNYLFYKGRITILENQDWESRYQDGSSGSGDSTLSTDEILIYDPETERSYIVVRYMTCVGGHRIKVHAPNGEFLDYRDLTHSGDLYEYYGTGLLWKKEPNPSSTDSSGQYTLSFAANPVRIDNLHNLVYTYPIPRQIDWVWYANTAGTDRRGGARIFTPEEYSKDITLNQVPQLESINASNTYGAKESKVFLATERLWKVSGTLSYNYQRLTYAEAMVEIEKLQKEVEDANDFKHLAKNHPPAWQETGALASQMDTLIEASQAASGIADKILLGDPSNPLEVRNAADTLVNNKHYQDVLSNLNHGGAATGAESSTVRKLEGVVIESSSESGAGPEQRNLKNKFSSVKAYLEDLVSEYASIHDSLMQKAAQIKLHLGAKNPPVEELFALCQEFRQHLESALRLNQITEQLVGDFGVVLYNLNSAGDVNKEYKFAELSHLFSLWAETFENGENTSVDLEKGVNLLDGYPSYAVPVMPEAVIAIAEKLPGLRGGNDGYTLTLKTVLSISQTVNYYEDNLWDAETIETETRDDITTFSGQKDGYEFSIMIMRNNLGGNEKTMVQITLEPVE
ncbi:MAG TPA: hypothetical protein VLH15_04575 [Dehalococcoidales bacterium]|nr:hypothetical protein [Dehalococcoidales bacterium]